jgi:hypothetical protein
MLSGDSTEGDDAGDLVTSLGYDHVDSEEGDTGLRLNAGVDPRQLSVSSKLVPSKFCRNMRSVSVLAPRSPSQVEEESAQGHKFPYISSLISPLNSLGPSAMMCVPSGDALMATSSPTSVEGGVDGAEKNWLDVGEGQLVAAVSDEHVDERPRPSVSGAIPLAVESSCVSLNMKHADDTGVGRESGEIGSVRLVLKGKYSVGGVVIRNGGALLAG